MKKKILTSIDYIAKKISDNFARISNPLDDHLAQITKARERALNKTLSSRFFIDTSLAGGMNTIVNHLNVSTIQGKMSIAKQLYQVSALEIMRRPKIEIPNLAADYMAAMNKAIKQ